MIPPRRPFALLRVTANDLSSRDVCALNDTVVAHENEPGQQILDIRGAVAAHGDQRSGVKIQHQKIGRLARLQTSALAIQ